MQYIQNKALNQRGFTLIEVLVVAPLVILLIGVTIGYISSLTGEGLKTSQRNIMTYDTQAALENIEQATSGAVQIASKTNAPLLANQGPNDSTNAFTSHSGRLVLSSAASTGNSFDPSRQTIYMGSGACDYSNPLLTYYSVYFLSGTTLYKRTIISTASPTNFCATPIQKNSCSPTVMRGTPPSHCVVEDEKLLDNVSSFSLTYRNDAGTTVSGANIDTATTVIAAITTNKTIAGSSSSYSATLRANLNSKSTAIVAGTTPSAPRFIGNFPANTFGSEGMTMWGIPTSAGSSAITGYRIRVVYKSVCSDGPQIINATNAQVSPFPTNNVEFDTQVYGCNGTGSGSGLKAIADAYISAVNSAGYSSELGGIIIYGWTSS